MKHLLLILCAFIAFSSCTKQKGTVTSIADGDTFTILDENNEQVRIRLYGIDCPEKSQAYGAVARCFTANKIFDKQVTVEKKDKDKYGRVIGIVFLPDGSILNEELLKAGLAWQYTAYDYSSSWAKLEATAKKNKLGLWQMKDPVAPWEFRKRKTRRLKRKHPVVNFSSFFL